jgi:hypothetical protein
MQSLKVLDMQKRVSQKDHGANTVRNVQEQLKRKAK